MTRKQIHERAMRRTIEIAQDRHIRIENARVERLEAEVIANYHREIVAFLVSR